MSIMQEAIAAPTQGRDSRTYWLFTVSAGHGVVHWFQQLYPVIIPSIKSSLGLNDVQLGALSSVKQLTSGPLMLPAGMLADLWVKAPPILLGAALAVFGIAYFFMGLAPSYGWMLAAVALSGVGTALWHPAAMAGLSLRYPEKRGTALAVHGATASVGDAIAPLAIGGILLVVTWEHLLLWHLIPGLVLGLVVWSMLRSSGRGTATAEPRPSVRVYGQQVAAYLRNRTVLSIMGVNVLSGVARVSVVTFFPLYVKETLGYSTFVLGLYIALLYAMGAVSQPLMGAWSDRLGRKPVLLAGNLAMGLLFLAMAVAAPGWQLSLVIAALGCFFYALSTVIQATLMDAADARVQASTMGLTGVFSQLVTLPAPILAGVIASHWGYTATFVYSSVATLLCVPVLLFMRVPRTGRKAARTGG